jgi:hypothetical protein
LLGWMKAMERSFGFLVVKDLEVLRVLTLLLCTLC